ncbi:sulfatase-like hydrolase/transferase [Haloarchaeobius amylolyticus]|uniref:sulfatase-like hydrolase/transferase n=1 Tax=Haloarchaeobius amylolyticus TaxID=1198296 RepID=UPI00226D5CAA|nr:sulfatase-like hydrolase/transferase [Haloarchaeobius amylolyticus]
MTRRQPSTTTQLTVPAERPRAEPRTDGGTTPANLLLVLADGLGYGHPGCYGGGAVLGAPTPNLDSIARTGLKLTNFSVEPTAEGTRSAMMTGRHPIRSGTGVPGYPGELTGLTTWETTIAEVLTGAGYATGYFGTWELGDQQGRFPTDQGFDEWYGIVDGPAVASYTANPAFDQATMDVPVVLEGDAGETPTEVESFDEATRATFDETLTERVVEFVDWQAEAGTPFFATVSFTGLAEPVVPHPAFEGRSGNGPVADRLLELDHRVGQLLRALEEAGIDQQTVVVVTSASAPTDPAVAETVVGPFRGTAGSALEGGLRVPFVANWPGAVPPMTVSNEVVHAVDVPTTLAAIAGVGFPDDRIVDGLDQRRLFSAKSAESAREGFPIVVNHELVAVKWQRFKCHFSWVDPETGTLQQLGSPRIVNVEADPREERDISTEAGFLVDQLFDVADEFEESLAVEPPIRPGTPDPYDPNARVPGPMGPGGPRPPMGEPGPMDDWSMGEGGPMGGGPMPEDGAERGPRREEKPGER